MYQAHQHPSLGVEWEVDLVEQELEELEVLQVVHLEQQVDQQEEVHHLQQVAEQDRQEVRQGGLALQEVHQVLLKHPSAWQTFSCPVVELGQAWGQQQLQENHLPLLQLKIQDKKFLNSKEKILPYVYLETKQLKHSFKQK